MVFLKIAFSKNQFAIILMRPIQNKTILNTQELYITKLSTEYFY